MIIPAGFCQVTHFFTGSSVPLGAAITYGVDNTASSSLTAIAVEALDAFGDTILTELSSSLTQALVRVKAGPNSTGPAVDVAGSRTGSEVGAAGWPNTAYLISKQTSLGGRQGRGRLYIPGVLEGAVTNTGAFNGADLTLMQTAANTFLGRWNTFGTPMVLLHGDVGTAPSDVIALNVSGTVATQRRRMRR